MIRWHSVIRHQNKNKKTGTMPLSLWKQNVNIWSCDVMVSTDHRNHPHINNNDDRGWNQRHFTAYSFRNNRKSIQNTATSSPRKCSNTSYFLPLHSLLNASIQTVLQLRYWQIVKVRKCELPQNKKQLSPQIDWATGHISKVFIYTLTVTPFFYFFVRVIIS